MPFNPDGSWTPPAAPDGTAMPAAQPNPGYQAALAQALQPQAPPPMVDDYGRPVGTDEANAAVEGYHPTLDAAGALGQSLASGHAAQDYAHWVDPDGTRTGLDAAASGFSVPAMVAHGADALVNFGHYAHDVQSGAYGDRPWEDQAAIDRGAPAAADMVATLGAGGMTQAEEGAVGAAGGKLSAKAAHQDDILAQMNAILSGAGKPTTTADDPFAAMHAMLDAQGAPSAAPVLHPRALPQDQLAQGVPDGYFQAFHGSPALFERFSMDNLGSGEGAQVQGHGMYFAGDQNVGAHYADTYGQPHTRPDGATVNGHMYQVAIPGHPDQFFNQDVSLTEQSPAVRAAVAPLYEANGLDPDYRGGNLLHELKQQALQAGVPYRDVDQHVSQMFADRGIPGHSYSGAGDAPNYVVFNPDGVRIMKTYANGDGASGAAMLGLEGGIDRQGAAAGSSALTPATPAPAPFTVYHGSPHRFDAFDMSKVGTGEGAQAYGHGMYFTDTEDVARGYRDDLSSWNVNGRPANPTNPNHLAAVALAQSKGDPVKAANNLSYVIDNTKTDAQWRAAHQAADMLWNNQTPSNRYKVASSGHMYEVGIGQDQDHFLDYDKPLSQQTPQVQQAIQEHVPTLEWYRNRNGSSPGPQDVNDYTGRDLYTALQKRAYQDAGGLAGDERHAASKVAASDALAQSGIPGIRYLDGRSRGAGTGTSNYVLFDPARDATINRVYARGVPLPGAAPQPDDGDPLHAALMAQANHTAPPPTDPLLEALIAARH